MKNEIKKKIKRNLPLIVTTLITAFLIFGCWCLGRFLGKKEENIVSASAESVSTFDTSNLFPLEYYSKSQTTKGLDILVNGDGSVTLNGTTTGQIVWYFSTVQGSLPYGLEVGETYTLSCSNMQAGRIILYSNYWNGTTWVNANWSVTNYSVSPRITIPNTWQGLQQYFIIYANQTFENETFYPMLNKGTVAYPFRPNDDYLENKGYEDGFSVGNESAKYGVFADCTVKYSYKESGVEKTYSPFTYYVDNGISLTNHAAYFSGKSNLTDIRLSVDFANPILASELTMVAGGDSALLSTNMFTLTAKNLETGKIVYLTAKFIYVDTLSSFGLSVETGSENRYNYLVYGFYGFNIPNVDSLKTLVFVDNDGKYMNGYNAGYNDGVNVGTTDGYNAGYTAGEKDGISKGYAQGYAKGESTGTEFGNLLFSIIDAPFRVFRETLNFEILGINLADLVAFIITGLLVLFVYKKIKGD